MQEAATIVWGACSEKQCKEYLLRPCKRQSLAMQCSAVQQEGGGITALKGLRDRSFLCMHYHLDRDHRLTPCALHPAAPDASPSPADEAGSLGGHTDGSRPGSMPEAGSMRSPSSSAPIW